MTDIHDGGPDQNAPELTGRDRLAAEYVLGLLDPAEQLEARGLLASDAQFVQRVVRWEDQLAPMLDLIQPQQPRAELWHQIEQQLAGSPQHGQVISLQRRLRRWQFATGFAAAAAIALAFLAAPVMRGSGQSAVPAPTPLVASMPIGDTPLRLGLTYLPDRKEMLVSASGLTADGVHDHELWLLPPEGKPQSLGVIIPGQERRMELSAQLAQAIHDGSKLALTREPLGGASPGTAAGPVVATGSFEAS